MDDVLLFTLAPEHVFYGEVALDLKTMEMTELRHNRLFVFVCRARAYFAYLYKNFFEGRPIDVYVNIDESGEMPKISLFVRVRLNPPLILGERDLYFLHGISQEDTLCWPRNNRVSQAIYGAMFATSPEKALEIRTNFKATGRLLVTVGCQDVPNFMVLTSDDVQTAAAERLAERPTSDFLEFVFSQPKIG